jgi:hypothetical protein
VWRPFRVIIRVSVALGIVVMISAMPTVIVSWLLWPMSRHYVLSVDDTIHQVVYIFIFIFILVGFPIRGSIGVRISPLRLMTRRRPRILMFSTHISSSRVVSAGVISGRESSR